MGATVLIIEDNQDNMELISFIMEKHDYRVLKAACGRQGIDMAVRLKPDFIILDIQLPDIDGVEVVCRLREINSRASIPIIAMTSYAMAGDREMLLAAGCTGYIEKPIDVRRVVEQIRRALGEDS